ncbi:hypothetical protein [Vibrio phage JSF13]|jgi:hypothetical protein|uniref:Uncharacterized protein ORF43 n=1 Tax=Vibrio phage ICP1 TaxID=979525 RepID=F1D165_9CAUD|nr:hypothetical protein ViPhICP1_gp043 [Vibrio phage ICP1]ADX88086.1 hypothetical protein TUST1-191_00200 [Vibrio phage ICP1_2006_D]ADX88313.1 hypothetical protein TUST1-182_00200 [Vibrio phage ICP1_2006_C]ADX88540.1 hypothetical protein TUST1-159_00200 [Vibrio phage ICP1_2006_B]ADX88766.1 hypothetical protein TUST1-17_00200 [Vibrio phage ICP1_2006_A]ADX88992.1 hypothetical protein TUST1-15_00200 [Vibrio phage ICP1_2005_A]ADX89224.1 hypothetical protein TUST1-2_00210 [Vibrio phage ICP1_2001_A
MKQGVYININGSYERVDSFRHSTERVFTKAHDKIAPEGRIFVVKCKDCGGSTFEDDGRFINEFSCSCCVESYTEVFFYKD